MLMFSKNSALSHTDHGKTSPKAVMKIVR